MDVDLYAAMRIFVRVAEGRSFSETARELNVAQSTVSKQITALEEHLGARLVLRTTRALSLTDDGRQFYQRSCEILDALAEAETTIVYSIAPFSSSVFMTCATVERFWPMAT